MGYRGKQTARARARELRARAWTLQQIADELGVAKSSVSVWVRDVAFTPRPRAGTVARRRAPNRLQRAKAAQIAALRAEGRARIGVLSDRDLLIAGLALYAGDGSKTDGRVRFTNTDARQVGLFCSWLRSCFDVDESRLRAAVYLHAHLDLTAAVAHWSEVTAIPPGQFGKPYRAEPDPTIRSSRYHYGCLTVSYSCSRTHRAIMGMVDALLDAPERVRMLDC